MMEFVRVGRDVERDRAASLAKALSVSLRTAQLLLARGVESEAEAEAFLYPSRKRMHDPMLFRDMAKACARINEYVSEKKRICVYGDYDVDGICATSMLVMHLRDMGADVTFRIPSRHEEGYGLNEAAVRAMADAGVKLVITVDNGIKSMREIALGNSLGMETIVTDHHIPDEARPDCAAILCHTEEDCGYPNRNICGAGTAYKLIEGLSGKDAAWRYIALAGVATIADVVPLVGENRLFAALGLSALNKGECPLGLRVLGSLAKSKDRPYSAHDVEFGIGPRLNAAGRVENADIAVHLMLETDETKAAELANKLCELNVERQTEERAIYTAVCAMVDADDITDKHAIVCASPDFNPGIVGIAAARVAEKYSRPTLLMHDADGVLTGSARSVRGVDLYAALKRNEALFTRFGGHAYAAGVTMPKENLDAFTRGFEAAFAETADARDFLPRREYEYDLRFSELSLKLADELSMLEPFGECNPSPVFRTDGVTFTKLKRVGANGAHLNGTVAKDNMYVDFVAFYAGESFFEIADSAKSDILYVPEIDEYNGAQRLKLYIKAIRPALPDDAKKYVNRHETKFYDAISRNIMYNSMRVCGDVCFGDAETRLKELLFMNPCGTLALCFTKTGAARALEMLVNDGLERAADVRIFGNRSFPCAYNTLVLAPVMNEIDASRFRHIVVLDTPVFEGCMAKLMELAPNADVTVSDAKTVDRGEVIARMGTDRAKLAVLYRALCSREGRYYNREAALFTMAQETGRPSYECEAALEIFIELSFVRCVDGAIETVKNAERKELMQSGAFAVLSSLDACLYECGNAERN